MLQIDVRHFASDALEDAMRLAQTKSLNSYTFSDCLSFLNYAWRDIYDRMAIIDDGYYGVNVQITKELTKLPPFVKNTVMIYSAQSPIGYDRIVYRSADNMELTSSCVYRISGTDLYCPDATRKKVWLYFVPACPQIFFTHHNRDPKIYENEYINGEKKDGHDTIRKIKYNLFTLKGKVSEDSSFLDISNSSTDLTKITKWYMQHNGDPTQIEDITDIIAASPMTDETDGSWNIKYISCDYPYIFVTYVHSLTGEHVSGFFDRDKQFNLFNPFEFTGRNSNIEYIDCSWNDKTGMGVIIKDWNDIDELGLPRIKELGWTPDTKLNYPIPEMYRYLVARLADKLSALNESNIMGVQKELIEAKYAFEAFLDKDKSSWKRITNVNPANIGDYL